MSEGILFGEGVPLWNSLAAQMLGWRPEEFWKATPAELLAAIREPRSLGLTAGPSRDLIEAMMERESHERQF